MKRILIAVLCAALLPLAACETPAGGGLPSPTIGRTTRDEQAMYIAEIAWKGANLSVQQAVAGGQVKGQKAAQVSQVMAAGQAQIIRLRTAYRLGQAVQERSLLEILAELGALGVNP